MHKLQVSDTEIMRVAVQLVILADVYLVDNNFISNQISSVIMAYNRHSIHGQIWTHC